LYITEKKYDLAFGELEQALRLDPNDYRSLYQIGRLSAQSGQNLDRGTAALCRCLALNPSMRPENPPRWFVLWRLGNICEKQGDLAGARARYRAALQAHADFPQVRDALRRIGG
jgi:tetratricopeptide (TPR) repeat protein